MSVLGYTNPSVSATNQFFNVLACPSGVWRYWHEGRLVWPLAFTIAIGTLPGVFIGAIVRINLLPNPQSFKIFAGLVLLYIGGRMAMTTWQGRASLWSRKEKKENMPTCEDKNGRLMCCHVLYWNMKEVAFVFQETKYVVATRALILLSLVLGLVCGIYGIGGGAIMAPFLVSFFGLPVYVVAGSTLFATFITSVAGVSFYALLAPFYPDMAVAPDWRMGVLVGLGGMCGMYAGARCQKFVPSIALKALLTAVLLFTAVRYLGQGF